MKTSSFSIFRLKKQHSFLHSNSAVVVEPKWHGPCACVALCSSFHDGSILSNFLSLLASSTAPTDSQAHHGLLPTNAVESSCSWPVVRDAF